MEFSHDIKLCLRNCILSVLWAKKDLYDFFAANGCTAADLKNIKNYDGENGLNRLQMVDRVFLDLSHRTDHGIAQFRRILQSLVEWSQFDPFYFEKLKKLDRATADNNLTHLRQLVEIRDARFKEERDKRRAAEAEKQKPGQTLAELRDRFLCLMAMNQTRSEKQRRGYELETILLELARLSDLAVTEPFRTAGEQIDGAFKFEGENYLLEAKWQDKEMSNEPLYQFAMKTGGKFYGRGVFVSINGFGEDAVRTLIRGKALNLILVDGEDLINVLENAVTFAEMLDRKINRAQNNGEIYVHPVTGKVKISL